MADDYDKDPNLRDTRPLDPYTPASLGSGPGTGYDQYGNARFEPVETVGRAPYILLGLLVAVGVIGGLVYFNHSPRDPEIATQSVGAPTAAYMQKVPATPLAHSTAPAH